jgi:3-oxoadipate enol-lactonase
MTLYVTQGGASLYYEWYPASSSRHVVVFFNGTGQCTSNWHHIRKLLADEASVLLFDARGQGSTSPGREAFSLAGHSRDAAELLEHLGITGANLAGVSHGAHVALSLAGKRPDLARAVAVSGLGAEYGPRVRLILSSWVRTLQSRGLIAWAREALPLVFGEAFLKSNERSLEWIEKSLVHRNDSWSLLRWIQALLQYPHPGAQAEAVSHPVLVLYGDDDPLLGVGQADKLARICEGETRCFPGAGHTLTAEVPEDFAACLREFFLQGAGK